MAFQPTAVPVGTVATQVYFPAKVGTPVVTIYNNGAAPTYLGSSSSVTASTGLLLSGSQEINFPQMQTGIWAICAANTGTSLNVLAGTY